jgi:S-DNA-T family DNA segregation ATPase FtsK/SpoIIIE
LGDDNTLAANLLGYGDFLYKTSTKLVRLQALYVGDAEEPEYFEQLLEEAIHQEDNFTAWEPDDIEEFSDSGIGSKAFFDNSFGVELNLNEQSKNSILNLHAKGYAINEIIKAVFNITRQDGKDYKKFRSAVEKFLDCEGKK